MKTKGWWKHTVFDNEQKFLRALSRIKLLALDFDGVLTDGYVYFRQDGMETVRCSRRDSLGTNMLQKAGIGVVVISKETNPVVQVRCKKMGVDYYFDVETGANKLKVLKDYIVERGIAAEEVVYVGDDVNDLECLQFAGIGIAVADSDEECKSVAKYVTVRDGGRHAVREVCDLILEAKRKEDENG